MEQNNKKLLSVCFAIAAVLIGVLTNTIIELLASASGFVARYVQSDLVQHVVPAASGVVAFLVLQFNSNIVTWGDDVISEIRKVVWRTPKETSALTIVVCIMLLICGLFFAGIDAVSAKIVNYLIML